MKKRKVKLFASIASLAMVVAVMGVGVWAASNQSVKISSTVAFEGSSVAATIDLAVSGDVEEAIWDNGLTEAANKTADLVGAGTTIATFELETTETSIADQTIAITLQDTDALGYYGTDYTVVYTFTINPTEGSADVFYKFDVTPESGWTLVTEESALTNVGETGIAVGAVSGNVVTVTLKPTAVIYTIDGTADLADITITLGTEAYFDSLNG